MIIIAKANNKKHILALENMSNSANDSKRCN